MSDRMIPEDEFTRRQIAKVLAQMIRADFEKARAERLSSKSDETDDEWHMAFPQAESGVPLPVRQSRDSGGRGDHLDIVALPTPGMIGRGGQGGSSGGGYAKPNDWRGR